MSAREEKGLALPRPTRESQHRAALKGALKAAAINSKADTKAIRKFSWEKD